MQTLAQNLPSASTRINWESDIGLPEGTIELRDEAGRVLGRIEHIGQPAAPVEPRFAVALRIKKLESMVLDLSNTVNAIADPDDYETSEPKTLETCQRLAAECIERNNL